jgi:hypothetical protein
LTPTPNTGSTADSAPTSGPHEFLADLKAALAARREGLGSDYKVTPAGLWTRSDLDEVLDLFVQIDLGQYSSMIDLGSGDGRVVCLASCFTRAVGIEADPWLVEQSRRLAVDLGLERAKFQQGELRTADLSLYDLLYIFPDKPLDWLERKPLNSWQGKLLVYGQGFQPKSLGHLSTLYAGSTLCAMWRR